MKRIFTFAIVAFAVAALGQTPAKKGEKPSTEKGKETEKIKEGPTTEGPPVAAVSSVEVEDIANFEHYAPQIQALIRKSLALTKLNLTYTFGSADPKNGGMDCSGTIYYVLHDFGFKDVPRQSNEMAGWVKNKTLLHRVNDADALTHPEFSALQPGDLLFWSGTYQTAPREIPVTHVMLYLGKMKKSGKHIVFGASDGRAYQGKRRTGVSVFDFSLPKSTSSASFYGFGMIPGVGKIEVKPDPVVAEEKPKELPSQSAAEKKTAAKATNEPVPSKEPAPAPASKPVPAMASAAKSSSPQDGKSNGKEEVRPAIRVEGEVKSATPSPAQTMAAKTASESKPAPAKVAATTKTTTTKPKSTASSKTAAQSKTTAKRKAPPPGPMERAKQATASFINDVRRSLPKGTGR